MFLVKATAAAANAANSAEHIPKVERAYIYGGFGYRGLENQEIVLQASMANYGKTPGFIETIEVGSATVGAVP